MKLIVKIWSIVLLPLVMLSCSASQKKTTVDEGNVDLVVQFFSKGRGLDRKVYPEFKAFLKENYPTLIYSETRYGREGETEFCFDLSAFKNKKKKTFISDTKNILSKSTIVNIKENAPCVQRDKAK